MTEEEIVSELDAIQKMIENVYAAIWAAQEKGLVNCYLFQIGMSLGEKYPFLTVHPSHNKFIA